MKNKGFTLIELLLVVAIIGIIAAIVLPLMFRSELLQRQAAADLESQQSVLSSPVMQVEGVVAENPVRISATNSLYHINLQLQWMGSPDQYTKPGQVVKAGKRLPMVTATGTFMPGQRVRCTQARTRSDGLNTWGPYDTIICDVIK